MSAISYIPVSTQWSYILNSEARTVSDTGTPYFVCIAGPLSVMIPEDGWVEIMAANALYPSEHQIPCW